MNTFMTYFRNSHDRNEIKINENLENIIKGKFPDFKRLDNSVWVFSSDENEMAVQHVFRHLMYQDELPTESLWLSPVDLNPERAERQAQWAPEHLVNEMNETRELLGL